jgi:NADPH:quinone reductase-like Zn-dependent oxidoreductase
MKTIILREFGGIDKLLMSKLPLPEILENEVLIEVKAISINPVDVRTRSGVAMANHLKHNIPLILGWDISGVVTDTGTKVLNFKKGDPVFGMVNFLGHGKGYAEYVAASENHIAHKPSNISHEEAAAATLAALTAWEDSLYQSLKVVKNGGKIISLLPMISDDVLQKAKEKNVEVHYSLVKSDGKDMEAIAVLLEKGIIKSHVSKSFSFDKMGDAHIEMETGKTVGKIIVKL